MKNIWQNIKSGIKKVWKWADGKKTYIGLGLHAGWCILNIIDKDLTGPTEYIEVHGYIAAITGTGAGHKVMKAINKAKKK